jgi:F0F1-type ATP synthase membrane subunit b/b'
MAQTGEILQSPAFAIISQQNPAAAMALANAWIESGDISQESKNAIKKALDEAAQQAQEAQKAQSQQAQELQGVQTETAKSDAELKRIATQKAMQDLAQAEAEQTIPNVGNLNI